MASRKDLENALNNKRVPRADDVYGGKPTLPALNLPRRRKTDAAVIEHAQALVKQGEAYRMRDFVLAQNGLMVPDDASDEDFEFVLSFLLDIGDRIQLWLGDLLVAIGIRYGATYEALAAWSGREEKTLRNYKWVCERVELSLRRDNLRFGHYSVIAGLDEAERAYWVNQASIHDWTVAELREALRAARQDGLPPPGAWVTFEKAFQRETILAAVQAASEAERAAMAAQLRELLAIIEGGHHAR